MLSVIEPWHFWFTGRRALVERLIATHLQSTAVRALDVGCGTAKGLLALTRHADCVIGLDIRPEGIGTAARAGARVVQADAHQLPFHDGAFDLIVMLDLLEHVDDQAAIEEAWRVLSGNGTAVITVPAAPWLWSSRDTLAGHRRRYTRRQLNSLLTRRFAVGEIGYYQCLLFPLVIATRLAARRAAGRLRFEERPHPRINRLLSGINALEVRAGRFVPWPWGSTLFAACRKRGR